MALINCPECRKEVSNTALTCPHCGFSVANYMREVERKQHELEERNRQLLIEKRDKKRQEFVEKMQKRYEEKEEKKSIIKQLRPTYLKQYGKKSLWIFAAMLPYSVISSMLMQIREYMIRKQSGILYENDNFFGWFFRNFGPLLPRYMLASVIWFLIPSVLYVIANNIKCIKTAKVLLIVGLIYNIVLVLLSTISGLSNCYIDVGMVLNFLIPFVAYIILAFNAIHVKYKSPLC